MQLFDNLSIRLKVLIAFSCVLIVTLALGTSAVMGLSSINDSATEIRDNWLPSVEALGRIAQLSERTRSQEGMSIMSGGGEQELALFVSTDAALKKVQLGYIPLISAGQERRLADAMDAAWERYVASRQTELAMLKDHKNQDAIANFLGAGREAFAAYRTALQADMDFSAGSGVAAATNGQRVFESVRTIIFVALALAALLCVAAGLAIVAGVARPIRAMAGSMGQLAGGDLTIKVTGATRRDEVGLLAKALQVFKDNGLALKQMEQEQIELQARSAAEQKAAMNRMADEFEAGVKGVVDAVASSATQLRVAAQSMTSTAEETLRQSASVAAAVEQTSVNVQTVASASEELSASIGEIGRQVSESSRVAGQAVEQADRTARSVAALAESAQKIGDVVKLIEGIASQTNLLALNATIEAARAGEAGKGFAVVASEVKTLANQTAQATAEIQSQIHGIQNATIATVSDIGSIGGTIGQINETTTAIAAAIEEQGAATGEITRNVQQAADGTQEVALNIAGVSAAAGETGAAAAQVLGSATELSHQAERLRTDVANFVSAVRAA